MEQQQLFLTIGRRIKEIRETKGISQQDLAAKCDFEKSNMSRIEAGKTNITVLTAFKICIALHINLSDLFNFEITTLDTPSKDGASDNK